MLRWDFQTGIDFLERPRPGRESTILIAPETDELFLKFLGETKMHYELIVPDVEKLLQVQKARLSSGQRSVRAKLNVPIISSFIGLLTKWKLIRFGLSSNIQT